MGQRCYVARPLRQRYPVPPPPRERFVHIQEQRRRTLVDRRTFWRWCIHYSVKGKAPAAEVLDSLGQSSPAGSKSCCEFCTLQEPWTAEPLISILIFCLTCE